RRDGLFEKVPFALFRFGWKKLQRNNRARSSLGGGVDVSNQLHSREYGQGAWAIQSSGMD
ncbi:MAG: hypothetical protein ABIQ35_01475, partial [Verrucomicrobiota bacterium]